MDRFICKIATVDDILKMYDEEVKSVEYDQNTLEKSRNITIDRINEKLAITYIGILNDEIIGEITAAIDPVAVINFVHNPDGLIDNKTAYLFNILVKTTYRNMGYFTKLFQYVLDVLKSKGYEKVTIGVDTSNEKNMKIYKKNDFCEHIKTVKKVYGKDNIIEIEYLGKKLK